MSYIEHNDTELRKAELVELPTMQELLKRAEAKGRADDIDTLKRLATELMQKKFDNDECHYFSKGVQALFVAFKNEMGEKNES